MAASQSQGAAALAWYVYMKKNDQKKPKPGDLIEIERDGFSEWAVYVGGGKAVHCTKGIVEEEDLDTLVGRDQWRVNNSLDKDHPPKGKEDIVASAKEQVGKKMASNLQLSHCERFATRVRYGRDLASQVQGSVSLSQKWKKFLQYITQHFIRNQGSYSCA
ncbi:phospholipase A and acyltransferase 4-like [Xenopus tropicalis]|uniref:Phospholipase A and acyltransferase 4-like n=1 Tax=Xenopus tropicalis TaxID=8364 RepID=A0A803JMP9_XENTR|nr:phospholipase A and acyltransferase 4-like [Xenopus tropicalis]